MSWKNIFALTSSILYLILISLLFFYYRINFICGYKSACIRFCSKDTEKFSNRILFDSLKKDNMTRYYDPEFEKITFFRGAPECNVQMISIDDVKVESDYYNSTGTINHYLYEDGSVYSRGSDFTIYKNCLALEDESADEWITMVCSEETIVQPTILVIMTILSLIILLATLTIYSFFSEFRDFYGKLIILFLSSVICTYIVVPGIFHGNINEKVNVIMGYGFTSGNLWLNSMILNIYFRCRDFRTLKSKDDKFKPFVIYVSIFTTFAVLFVILDMTLQRNSFSGEFISLVHYYLILNDLIVLIITSIIIRNVSKQIDISERLQLEKEKKLFWIYVKLFAIMSVTWSTQIFALKRELNQFGCLTVALIMLFSAVNVAGLFLGRRKVRNLLTEQYNRAFNRQSEMEF
ncbi:hypothetical protein ACKWTF_008960 [Chironomus riparius]